MDATQLNLDFSHRPRPQRRAYYDTTRLRAGELVAARSKARTQDVLVLAIMRNAVGMTPSMVWVRGRESGANWLLTSVRRSMNTLTREGVLVRTELTQQGPYGRPEGVWRLSA